MGSAKPVLTVFVAWIMVLIADNAVAAGGRRIVSLELVLAIDSSASVDDAEYNLQLQGIGDALRRPEIINAILQHREGVAIALVQWGGWADSILDPPWRLLDSAAAIRDLAGEIDAIERGHVGPRTALGHAINVSIELLETNTYVGRQRKIDVSGDGRSNSGQSPLEARQRALARNITINGLAILTNDAGLYDYYETEVAIGPARFVLQIDTFDDYAVAIARKMHRELLPALAMVREQGVDNGTATGKGAQLRRLNCVQ